MHRKWLREKLAKYLPIDPDDEQGWIKLKEFVENNPDCFDNNKKEGHITGSAFVISPDKKKVLLTHHLKLGKWLQLGGHADNEPMVLEVALREAKEESGIKDFILLSEDIFDLDVHLIPARSKKPSHFHYDVRFLLQAPVWKLTISNESRELAWINLEKIGQHNNERSMTRMTEKFLLLEKPNMC